MSESFHINFIFLGPVLLKKIFKDFSYINTCKNGFPYCGPTQLPGTMILTNWFCTMSNTFHANFTFSGPWMHLYKQETHGPHPSPESLWQIFKDICYTFTDKLQYGFPIVAPSNPRGLWFEQTWICTMSGWFHENLNSSGTMVLEKIFKDFSYIRTYKI
jgi:hypothetical protein